MQGPAGSCLGHFLQEGREVLDVGATLEGACQQFPDVVVVLPLDGFLFYHGLKALVKHAENVSFFGDVLPDLLELGLFSVLFPVLYSFDGTVFARGRG